VSGRLVAIANLCPAIIVAALIVVRLAQSASPVSGNVLVEPGLVSALAADASVTEKLLPIAFGRDEIGPSVTETVPDVTGTTNPPAPAAESLIQLAMADPTEQLPLAAPPEEVKAVAAQDQDPGGAAGGIDSVLVLDECFVAETCMNRYLWALYQRTPKEDTVAEQEERKVTVKKRGKLVTVTRTINTRVNEEFSWKDRKAAERANMSLMDYVIGGVDQAFKRRLFNMLFAAERAGFSPGITSAFRDDYRQSIASGLKAADNRSYHGGSLRGGYGHGLAADVVSVKGETRAQRRVSTEAFWNWIDAHGQEFGIGRPYLDHDPPHVGPIDGNEYVSRRGTKVREASKERSSAPARHHAAIKHTRTARSSKVRAT
jgi:D-alanyl-D-alanine carboxypeptidase